MSEGYVSPPLLKKSVTMPSFRRRSLGPINSWICERSTAENCAPHQLWLRWPKVRVRPC